MGSGDRMLSKILAPFIYLIAWLLFHTRQLLEATVRWFGIVLKIQMTLSIHTFAGAALAVFYYYLFTGRIPQFHGYYDAMPLMAEYARAARGAGAILIMAAVSVLLIIFGGGLLRFLGYFLIFWVWLTMSAFETPKPIKSAMKASILSVPLATIRTMEKVAPTKT